MNKSPTVDTETFSHKFHAMNIMKSGARLIKQSISRACRNHAFGIHESRHSPPICKKNCGRNLKIKIQKYKIIKIIKEIEKLFVEKKSNYILKPVK